jgi:hypothetical protein
MRDTGMPGRHSPSSRNWVEDNALQAAAKVSPLTAVIYLVKCWGIRKN